MSIMAEAKKLEIFSLDQMELNPGGRAVACRVVSLGHCASSVPSLQIGHYLRWSDLHLCLCALAAAPLSAVVNMLNKREESGEDCTWRGGQSGPSRSMAVHKQVHHRKNTSS